MKKRNKLLALFLALAILLSAALPALMAGAADEERAEAQTQTEDDPNTISIRSAEDLMALAEQCRLDTWSVGKAVTLCADISLEGTDFASIPSFGGSFDGGGHTISGLTLTETLSPCGLFSQLQAGGGIRSLTVSGTVAPEGDAQFVGGIVGENHGSITNCTFTGSVAGSGSTGGIVGINALSGTITDCEAHGLVLGADRTGGVAGCNLGSITGCVNRASVNTDSVDPSLDPSDIDFDFVTDVSKLRTLDISSAATDTGGIAGYSSGIIRDCANQASVGYPHIGYNVGGIVGRSCGFVDACRNTGAVYGRKDVGGIAGQLEPTIARNLSESGLASLQRQLRELDALLDTALGHAGGASATLTDRLNAIASAVDSAAEAARDIRTGGTITGSAAGTVDGSTGGSVTVTPIEGGLSGGIRVEDGSVSGGIGGSLSGGAAGEGSTSIGAGLDARAQIDISTNLAGLSSALSDLAGQMSLLGGELSDASGELLTDARQIKAKLRQVTDDGLALLTGEGGDIVTDGSDVSDIDSITLGKALDCVNSAAVSGDIAVGGITGSMGLEYTLDPEDELHGTLDGSTRRRYELCAVAQRCENTGAVLAKRNYAGGIVGKMDIGLAAGCEAYGSVASENGNYVGGIAGLCASTVRQCFAKCSLSGGKYIGGIVGSGVTETATGSGSTVTACYAMVTITEHEQYIGAVSGAYAGTFLENYFVSESLAGINGMSYTGCAQPISYADLLARFDGADGTGLTLPDAFRAFTLRFVAEGEMLASEHFAYGASFPDSAFPNLPEKEGYYAHWDRDDLRDLRFDTTVTAVYEPYITALGSAAVRDGDRPVFFAEGNFGETGALTAAALALTPGEFHLASGLWDTIGKSLLEGKVNTEVVEQWQLQISEDGAAAHTLRYLPPDDDAAHMDVYALQDGAWRALETEVIGSYVTFTVEGDDVQLAVVHSVRTWWAWLVAAALALAVVLLIVRLIRGYLKRISYTIPSPAETGSSGNGLPDTDTAERGESAPVGGASPAKGRRRKKRRRVAPVLVLMVLLAGILGAAAWFLLPGLMAEKGAYEALSAALAQDELSLTLEVEAQVGTADIPLTADITRTVVDGQQVTAVTREGRALYYAEGLVLLEDGTAYRVSDTLPDYSRLLETAAGLYRLIDAETVDGVYFLTAAGENAEALLRLLLPSASSLLSGTDELRLELITEEGALSQIRFSGGGRLGDAASSPWQIEAALRVRRDAAGVDIPSAVRAVLTDVAPESAKPLSDELYRLLSGWQDLTDDDFWSAETTLGINCGPLELEETLELYHWRVEDAVIWSVQENGYGLYASGDTVCDSSGNTVPVTETARLDAAKLVDILYELCLNGFADCDRSGEATTYTLALDGEGMAALARSIAPETENMNVTFTAGTVTVVMEGETIRRVEIGLSGSVPTALGTAEAGITAVLDFAAGKPLALPDAVRAALTAD